MMIGVSVTGRVTSRFELRTRPRVLLASLVAGQDGKCAYCAEPFGSSDLEADPTIDHVIPLSAGGSNTRENKVAACRRCNEAKGDMAPVAFRIIVENGLLPPRRTHPHVVALRECAQDYADKAPKLGDLLRGVGTMREGTP